MTLEDAPVRRSVQIERFSIFNFQFSIANCLLGFGIVALLGLARALAGTEEKLAPGRVPPALEVAGWVNTDPMTLAGLKGKVVVLDFWGIFCAPCRKLMPHLSQLYEKHRGEGLVVLGVSEDERPDIEKFAKEIEAGYPLAADRLVEGNGVTLKAYSIVAIPTVYLIGRNGKIAWIGDGPKLTDKMVLDELGKK